MTSTYAKRMAELSARIFSEMNIKNKLSANATVIERFKVKPVHKQIEYSQHYYPRHQELDYLTLKLRDYGLYRDELRDFRDEMARLAKLRGKGKKPRQKYDIPPTITVNENFVMPTKE